MHDGSLEDIFIKGESVLEREIKHAREIPADERVMVR